MKIILILLLSLPIFAEEIGDFTNYYLKGRKTHFINPGRLDETQDQLYVESKGEVGFKKDNYFLGATGERLSAAIMPVDNFGLSAFISAFNGEGIEKYGARFGTNLAENYNFYLGFTDGKEQKFVPHFGLGLEVFKGALFLEYTGQIASPDEYSYKAGWGKVYDNMFGDLTYASDNFKNRALAITVGGKSHLFERLIGTAAISKELYFTKELKASTHLQWFPTNRLELYLINNFMAFGLADPKYGDFDVNVGLSYYL